MSSKDDGADCANGVCNRAETFGVEDVVSFNVSSTTDDVDDECSEVSCLSFFTSIFFLTKFLFDFFNGDIVHIVRCKTVTSY